MSTNLWTIERVKAELPTVQVKLRATGETLLGQVLGRKLEFARVMVWLPFYRIWHTEEYAWGTVAYALNEGKVFELGEMSRAVIAHHEAETEAELVQEEDE